MTAKTINIHKHINLTNVSPLFLLFLVFLVLKLTSVITWSWWWVTAPLWGPLAIVAGIIAAIIAVLLVIAIVVGLILLAWFLISTVTGHRKSGRKS